MIEAIAARLDALRGDALVTLGQLAEYAALEAPPPPARCPAAYVIELADEASPNALATGTRQRLTERAAVVLIVSALRDARGGPAMASLRPLRQAVRARLLGWPPSEAHDGLTYQRGRLLAAASGVIAWQDEYAARSIIQGAA
jgi:hypothetical protein